MLACLDYIRGSQGSVQESDPNSKPSPPVQISPSQSPKDQGVAKTLASPESSLEIREDETSSYGDRKKFWEQMSSSSEKKSFTESVESVQSEISKTSSVVMRGKIQVETAKSEIRKSLDEVGLVKSLTESYSEKIAAGELVMPALPRPLSGPPKLSEAESESQVLKGQSSTDRAVLSELEARLSEKKVGEPATGISVVDDLIAQKSSEEKIEFMIGESVIKKEKQLGREESADSEADFLAKYGEEVLAFENSAFVDEDEELPISERKEMFEENFKKRPPPVIPSRKSIYERSMSLPAQDIADGSGVRSKKRHFEAQMKQEIIVEQLMTQVDEEYSPPEHKSIADAMKPVQDDSIQNTKRDLSPEEIIFKTEVEEVAKKTVKELITESEDLAHQRRKSTEMLELELTQTTATAISSSAQEALQFKRTESVSKPSDSLEVHIDKSETESREKDGEVDEILRSLEKEEVPSITITGSGARPLETLSVGESEDTQSESDVTPEEARMVDNVDVPWDITTIQTDVDSSKDEIGVHIRDGQRIGRWVGQENLAQEAWGKSGHQQDEFPVETKWERTRSESASPKDPVVYTPEEHYPDTVWEVPVQEQLDTEEVTQDIPIEKQTIIEKDEEEDDEERELTNEEARDIAEDIVGYIENEVEKRAALMGIYDDRDVNDQKMDETFSIYIRQLAGEKDLDEREVELIESVLARKQREEIMKIQRKGTAGSSIEITDEDLRSSGVDTDASPGESQVDKPQDVKSGKETAIARTEAGFSKPEAEPTDQSQKTDEDVVAETIAEVKESLEAAQEELIEQHKKNREGKREGDFVKASPSEFQFKSIEKAIAEEQMRMASHREDSDTAVIYATPEKGTTSKRSVSEYAQDEEYSTSQMRSSTEYSTEKIAQIQTEIEESTKKETEVKSLETISENQKFTKHKQTHFTVGKENSEIESMKEEYQTESIISQAESKVSGPLSPREVKRGSSEDSADDGVKSPPPSSSSSGGRQTATSKSDIVLRHSSSSSRSGRKTTDRLSAIDIEPYSSSGESHYQSFEQTSSRPCSSDVEALLASGAGTTGSSEYESAVSQSRFTTTGEYVTAKSSLSSRESIKSLDSESSGHLGSVEISSEASETLIASAMELDRDEGSGVILLDDDSPDMLDKPTRPAYMTQHSAPATANRGSIDEDFEPVSDCEPVSWTGEASEDEITEPAPSPPDATSELKMKRSQEMTFQPIPKPIISTESVESSPGDVMMDKYTYGSSADETMSMISLQDERLASSLEETGSVLSMSLSTASEASAVRTIIELSRTESDKIDTSMTISGASADSGSREELDSFTMSIPPTTDIGTSTSKGSVDVKSSSVTMTTSSVDESGTFCVSTQVTSLSRKSSEAEDTSQSSLGATSTSEEVTSETTTKKAQGHRRKESTSSFVPSMLWTVGETKPSKVKIEVDDVEERAESDQFSDRIILTEKEGKNDEKKESDDSEKTEESHQTEADQAINQDLREGKVFVPEPERTISPDEFQSKDDTPELSSEAQASVTELEMEYSGAYSRTDEYASHVSPIREERSETQSQADMLGEKHELELGEKMLSARVEGTSPSSPGEIPGITVTQHLAPLVDRDFHYPDLELEEQEAKKGDEETPQTPASISSRASSTTSTDQGREYVVNEDSDMESKQTTSVSTVQTVREPLKEEDELSSPNSDSFELLDKPDLSEEYVIIEEVGKEAEEHDKEGKSVAIGTKQRKVVKKKETEEEELIESPPAPATKMTNMKYFPGEDIGPFPFESEGSSTSASSSANSEEADMAHYEQQLEESKRWIEMQFAGEQTGLEYERGPLEDIKEEELNEFDSSSKIGSMGSMKESLGGSFGSMKGSFSSTPDYDVLAGKKYFTRGDNDDGSISSLQEFELLEKKILDGRKSGSSGSSQDSLNCRRLGTSNKSAGGDDISGSSLKEFETIESVCVKVVKIEKKAKEEEILLSEIEEGHESQVSESESCETMSAGVMEKESDSEDFDRKMFEIDEIIKQAKTNVEGFMDFRGLEQTESVGRGDSFEEVSRIPDLELDNPENGKSHSKHGKVTYSTQVVTKKQVQKWRAEEDELLRTSTDSPDHCSGSDSLEIKQQRALSISVDSIEQEAKKKGSIMTDSIEQGDTISIDSFDMRTEKKGPDTFSVDSFEPGARPISEVVSDSLEALHRSDSLEFGEDEAGAMGRAVDPPRRPPPRSDYMLGSSDSLDPSSSTANTHATYHYETDSVMSSSFTSGGSNTLVSDGETQDLEGVDFPSSSGAWFENLASGGEPFVTEVVERLDDDEYSHTIHRTVETAPDVRKVVFTGPGAEQALKDYIEGFEPGEDVTETEEVDEHGNIHIKRVVQRRIVVRPDELDEKNMTPEQLKTYFKQFETENYGSSSSQFSSDTNVKFGETLVTGDSSQTKSSPLSHANIGKPAGRQPKASLFIFYFLLFLFLRVQNMKM